MSDRPGSCKKGKFKQKKITNILSLQNIVSCWLTSLSFSFLSPEQKYEQGCHHSCLSDCFCGFRCRCARRLPSRRTSLVRLRFIFLFFLLVDMDSRSFFFFCSSFSSKQSGLQSSERRRLLQLVWSVPIWLRSAELHQPSSLPALSRSILLWRTVSVDRYHQLGT